MSETEIWPTPVGFGRGIPAPDDFPPEAPDDLEGLIDYEEVTPESEA